MPRPIQISSLYASADRKSKLLELLPRGVSAPAQVGAIPRHPWPLSTEA